MGLSGFVPALVPALSSFTSSLLFSVPCLRAKLLQARPTLQLCRLEPPGSSVHGILQARILEWVAMASSRGSSPPRDQTPFSLTAPLIAWIYMVYTQTLSHPPVRSCQVFTVYQTHSVGGVGEAYRI